MNNNTLEAIEKICITLIAISFFAFIAVVATHEPSVNSENTTQTSINK